METEVSDSNFQRLTASFCNYVFALQAPVYNGVTELQLNASSRKLHVYLLQGQFMQDS